MLENQNNNQENDYKIFYCYSYRLSKYLKWLGFNCIEVDKNPSTNRKYWAFENPIQEKMDLALKEWEILKENFEIK